MGSRITKSSKSKSKAESQNYAHEFSGEPPFYAPAVDLKKVLEVGGIIIPEDGMVLGNPCSSTGARIFADKVRFLPDVELVKKGNSVFALRDQAGISGEFTCLCGTGDGTCQISTSSDSFSCTAVGMCSECKMYVTIPDPNFSSFVLRAMGLKLSRDAEILGSLSEPDGILLRKDEIRLTQAADSHFVQESESTALLISSLGVIQGSFSCTCSGDGRCDVTVGPRSVVCKSADCKGACESTITVPGIAWY